jgi:hypothetical protein
MAFVTMASISLAKKPVIVKHEPNETFRLAYYLPLSLSTNLGMRWSRRLLGGFAPVSPQAIAVSSTYLNL